MFANDISDSANRMIEKNILLNEADNIRCNIVTQNRRWTRMTSSGLPSISMSRETWITPLMSLIWTLMAAQCLFLIAVSRTVLTELCNNNLLERSVPKGHEEFCIFGCENILMVF